jgi:hypothetical protein
MFRDHQPDPRLLPLTPAALDAGATIQDAVVRRLRFVRAASADGPPPLRLEDRPLLYAVVGRKR